MSSHSHFLHPDAEIVRRGRRESLIINRRANSYFRIGDDERRLLDLFETGDSLDSVLTEFHARYGRALTKRHVREFVQQLWEAHLLGDAQPAGATAGDDAGEKKGRSPSSLLPSRPDNTPRLNFRFDLLTLLLGWAVHPWALIPTVVLVALAAQIVVRSWDIGLAQLADLFEVYPLPLFLLWFVAPKLLLLNFVQAVVAGIACRSYGGRVRSFGLRLWERFVPVFQIDVGNSLVFMDQQGRLTMIFLGLWCPIVIGSASLIGWAMVRSDSGLAMLYLLLVPACLIRILFHCNIFFGSASLYLALCNALGDWNLLDAARAETRAWLARCPSPKAISDQQRQWYRLYGIAYYLYRALLAAALLIAGGYWIAGRYDLIGALVVVAAVFWFNRDLVGARKPQPDRRLRVR